WSNGKFDHQQRYLHDDHADESDQPDHGRPAGPGRDSGKERLIPGWSDHHQGGCIMGLFDGFLNQGGGVLGGFFPPGPPWLAPDRNAGEAASGVAWPEAGQGARAPAQSLSSVPVDTPPSAPPGPDTGLAPMPGQSMIQPQDSGWAGKLGKFMKANSNALIGLGAGISAGGLPKGLAMMASAARLDDQQRAQNSNRAATYLALINAGVAPSQAQAALLNDKIMAAVVKQAFDRRGGSIG